MNDLAINGSGYYDETAYKAIRNAEKNSNRGGDFAMNNYKAGDIVEMETQNCTREGVLIRCHESYATAMILSEKKPMENAYSVKSRNMMWTDTGKIGYVFYDNISGYVRSCNENEFENLISEIGETLGFCEFCRRTPETGEDCCADVQQFPYISRISDDSLEEIRKMIKEAVPIAACEQQEKPRESCDDLIRTETERDIYKELYMNLLAETRK